MYKSITRIQQKTHYSEYHSNILVAHVVDTEISTDSGHPDFKIPISAPEMCYEASLQ